jgi:ketosteroid isomerase-like protein
MKISPFFLLFFVCFIFLTSCDLISPSGKETSPASVDEVLRADREFSDMSKHIGIKKAYTEYMSDDGILLRPDFLPITGASAVDYLSTLRDEDYELSWEPQGGMIAKSGELGFTYGVYHLKTEDTIYEGTYTNIWKKNGDGPWRYVLNTSNAGISSNQ